MNLTNKSTYDYFLPEELIAQHPIEPRDSSRMLVFNRKNNEINHKHFYDIENFLNKGDVLVLNSSRVLPARLYGIKAETQAKIEVLLQKRLSLTSWEIILRPFKRVVVGTQIEFSENLKGTITKKLEEGLCNIEFEFKGVFEEILEKIGSMPLPHYIKEKLTDKERYQTVYSKENGSSAAPTAGLHFTKELLEKLKQKGVQILEVILHVGLGTFRPVKDDNILEHKMHFESYHITQEVADAINQAKNENRRIIAVGTTTVRVLETCVDNSGVVFAGQGETNIFIYPPYKFKVIDALITNFHLPQSTLIMLVSAFCGLENTKNIYKTAVDEKYRFFSFGDAVFIE
jgi:S-adenosylmethionine:tRNA ribosyltransferase-isomerase